MPPQPISEYNVQERAATLLDQYKKKAELYRTNVLLVPLGDDFRYDTEEEWNQQNSNYQKLFTHINARAEWNAHVRFGTLEDYFKTLRERTHTAAMQRPEGFPVLSGDFFTYADRDDHYWSGYYTTRPLHKRLDRVLIHYLRGAEIAYSLSLGLLQKHKVAGFPFEQLFQLLVQARRNLALFQHHDGITGTAKDNVVVDYGRRMLNSIQWSKDVIAASLQFMLTPNKPLFQTDINNLSFDIDERRQGHDSLAEKVIIGVADQQRTLVFYNSLPHERRQVQCIQTETVNVEVKDGGGSRVPVQINPVVYRNNGKLQLSTSVYEVCMEVAVPPVGISVVSIESSKADQTSFVAKVRTNADIASDVFSCEKFAPAEDGFSVESPFLGARFSTQTGYLQWVKLNGEAQPRRVELEFVKYGTTKKKDKSGAYLFLPDGPAKSVSSAENQVMWIEGPLISSVTAVNPVVQHTVSISKIAHSVDSQTLRVNNIVNIKQEFNYELAMRVKSDIANRDRTFFTDLNGFQHIKRKFFSKIPLQANFYPMPTATFVEDDRHRLSLLSGQPLGVASLETGWLEVMLDRRLMQDDNRGLFQGITDNRVTPDSFTLALEPMDQPRHSTSSKTGYLTLLGHHASQGLLHPLFTFFRKEIHQQPELLPSYSALSGPFPCDIQLVNLRTLEMPQDYSSPAVGAMPRREHALLLHRFVIDCRSGWNTHVKCNSSEGELPLQRLLSDLSLDSVVESSLTLMHRGKELDRGAKVILGPMDLSTLRLKFKI